MSYQAPFVDAARSVDPVNRGNTFISYYTYGSALGLALDLSLREKNLNLDEYMTLVWTKFGKEEKPYTISDLQNTLNEYAGDNFGDNFFNNYVHKSGMPEMKRLFENVGVLLTQDDTQASFGASVRQGKIFGYTSIGSSAYEAGLENDDTIIQIGDVTLNDDLDFNTVITKFKPNDTVKIVYKRLGNTRETTLTFKKDPSYSISIDENASDNQKAAREVWLRTKV